MERILTKGKDPDDTRGGPRPGSGRKKGTKNRRTLIREEALAEIALRNQISQDIRMMLPLGVRKKGLKKLEEITMEEIEKEFKQRVGFRAHSLLNAQMSLALGTQTLYKVQQTVSNSGKVSRQHVLVTDPDEIRRFLDDPNMIDGNDYFYITTKAPDNNAINALLDRLMGKTATKIVGANNSDGSEGPIKVIVANFNKELPAADPVQPIIEHVIEEAVSEDTTNDDINTTQDGN